MIARYRRSDWRVESARGPPSCGDGGGNGGPEAMVRLPDGRFLVFSEGRDNGAPSARSLLFTGDPAEPGTRAAELRYRRPGRLSRHRRGVASGRPAADPQPALFLAVGISAKLVVAEVAGCDPGRRSNGARSPSCAARSTVDNMEALSVARESGRTIVRIASDDNFMRVQQTLLLEFEPS